MNLTKDKMWEQSGKPNKELFNLTEKDLANLSDEDIKSIIKFITIRKLSNKYPYDDIKEKFDMNIKFVEYFLINPYRFTIIYEQWKEYNANRGKSNKARISERNNKASDV